MEKEKKLLWRVYIKKRPREAALRRVYNEKKKTASDFFYFIMYCAYIKFIFCIGIDTIVYRQRRLFTLPSVSTCANLLPNLLHFIITSNIYSAFEQTQNITHLPSYIHNARFVCIYSKKRSPGIARKSRELSRENKFSRKRRKKRV